MTIKKLSIYVLFFGCLVQKLNVRRGATTQVLAMWVTVGGGPGSCIEAAIFGTTGTPLSPSKSSDLFVFNETTGCGTFMGAIKINNTLPVLVNGLAYDYSTGKLYATTDPVSRTNPSSLLIVDPYTGHATLIGKLLAADGDGVIGLTPLCCPAINSTGQLFAFYEKNSDMYTVDKTTGAAKLLGRSGTGLSRLGISFDDQNTMHMIQSLFAGAGVRHYQINTTDGSSTTIANFDQRDKVFIFNADPKIAPLTNFPTAHGFVLPGTSLFYSVEYIYYLPEGDYNSDRRRGNRIKIYNLQDHNISAVIETSVSPLLTLAYTDFDVEPCDWVSCEAGKIYMYEFTRINSKPAGIPTACFQVCVDDVPTTYDRFRSLDFCCGRCNKRLLG